MERDLILMSLCIFVPSVFALGLLFFPKGTEEGMRWWSLVGTAVTFVLSTFVFVDYLGVLDRNPDKDFSAAGIRRAREKTSLAERALDASKNAFEFKEADDKDQ